MGNKPSGRSDGANSNNPKGQAAAPPTNHSAGGRDRANNESNRNQGGSAKPSPDAITKYTFWLTVFTGLLFVTSVISAIVTYKQWTIANEQIGNNHEQLKAVIIAPSVIAISPTKDYKTNVPIFALQAQWQNVGSTRTSHFETWTSAKYFPDGVPNALDLSKPYDSIEGKTEEATVGPNTTVSSVVTISKDDVESAITKGIILIWGYAEYSDIFKSEILHPIRYCRTLDVSKSMDGEIVFGSRPYKPECNNNSQ